MVRWVNHWLKLRASLWFVPAGMSAASVTCAFLLLHRGPWFGELTLGGWLAGGNAQSARDLLGALLAGMITMTSLVVSITMVVLTLAAGQLGPRLIRSFTDDRATQVVLGLFVATILYLLVVLRAIEDIDASELPHLAILVGTLLTASCLFVLLFFVDRLAASIVPDRVARRLMEEMRATVARSAADASGDGAAPDAEALAGFARRTGAPVLADTDGYVDGVDHAGLLAAATEADACLRLHHRPGDWVIAGTLLAEVFPPAACTEALVRCLRQAVAIGPTRTPAQDVPFELQRLVEMAVRALSPGINDPFTAIGIVDTLGSCLAQAFDRRLPAACLADDRGRPRLLQPEVGWSEVIDAAFDPLRHAGAHLPAIAIRLSDTLAALAPRVRDRRQREALLRQLEALADAIRSAPMVDKDRRAAVARAERARRALQADGSAAG